MASSALERLTGLVRDPGRFDIPHSKLVDEQVEAMDEVFQDRRGRIKLLAFRAREAGVERVGAVEDAVALLFPHTAYKSYPESFLAEQRWDRLTKWLGTVSSHPITGVNLGGLTDIDGWVDRLAGAGHYVSCSSGTTGKSAMLVASEADMAWSRIDTVGVFAWGSGVEPAADRRMFGVAPTADVPKNINIRNAQVAAFGDPRWEPFRLPVEPITIGRMTRMVVLRRAIADGTARPEEIADFDRTAREREAGLDAAYTAAAEALVAARADKLFISGMWNALFHVAGLVRQMGYASSDFNPDNCLYVGGGLKRAQLPADYQEVVYGTFGIPAHRRFQNYSMQELNSGMPRCQSGGRYHIPPWVVPLVLDRDGSTIVPAEGGVAEGRAAFFDLALEGRWGGVITGDKVTVDFGPCPCGQAGATIGDDIVRYADLEGDDKIGCAGTVDAYVRGMA